MDNGMSDVEMQDCLRAILETETELVHPDDPDVTGTIERVDTFSENGLLTQNAGVVVRLEDGSEWQITIVQSRPRRVEQFAGMKESWDAIDDEADEAVAGARAQAAAEAAVMDVQFPDVTVELIGEDGNAFAVIGRVKTAIALVHGRDAAQAFTNEAYGCDSYDALLRLVMRTVEVS